MALRSNLFLICLVSSSLAYGKLNAKNFGITLNILQLVKNFISRSAFFNFIDSFSNFRSCCVDFHCLKICDLFSAKDSLPNALKSYVVYKFTCAGCQSCYVGETKRHLPTRIKDHLETD